MGENNDIPQIRFKEFDENWEGKEFKEIFSNIPNNTLSRAQLNYQTGLFKNVHYGDVLIKFGELLDVKNDRIPFISNDALGNKFKLSKLQNGDIIIADTAEDESVGKCTELINVGNENVVSGLHTIPVRPTQHFASKYLGYYLNSSSYHNQLLQLMQGIKVLSISKSALKSTVLVYPPEKLEQSQIGTYFQNLDKLIILQQQKHDKLVTLKKAMLDKMFPKEGADVPEVRFKGFEGEWKEKKLGDVTHITTGKLDANAMKKEGKYDFYTSGIQKYKIDVYAFEGPAITIAGNGATVGYMHFANGLFNAYQRTYVLFDFTENREFLYFEISKVLPLKIKEEARSGNIPYIVLEMLTDLKIKTPSLKEQSQIGSFFHNLDKLISLQQQEIQKLKNIKKACLEKMFV